MQLRYLTRLLLLTLGFGLTTFGLLAWQQINFDLNGVWPLSRTLTAHPVYAMVLGLALIPPTLWEIFVLEHKLIAPTALLETESPTTEVDSERS
jgi:hypothetical protein